MFVLFIYLFIYLFIHLFFYFFIFLFFCLFIYSFFYLFIYLFIHLFIYLFLHLFNCLFNYLFISPPHTHTKTTVRCSSRPLPCHRARHLLFPFAARDWRASRHSRPRPPPSSPWIDARHGLPRLPHHARAFLCWCFVVTARYVLLLALPTSLPPSLFLLVLLRPPPSSPWANARHRPPRLSYHTRIVFRWCSLV